MTFLSCITSQDKAIVLDASVVINLLATSHATQILKAIPVKFLVTSNVLQEIRQGEASGRQEPKGLSDLIDARSAYLVDLNETALQHFFALVSGSTLDTLGDGEAATLALAFESGYCAGIDEKKATRIALQRFEALKLVTTIDILGYPEVQISLGRNVLASATLQALKVARMQVKTHQLAWILELVSEEDLQSCSTLRKYKKLNSYGRLNAKSN
jgi:predicted nucleic acid-binding protein